MTRSEQYYFADIYEEANLIPKGALQSYGGTAGPNKEGGCNYGGQEYDSKKGTLIYNNIKRYGIAIGPKLQYPDFNVNGKEDPVSDDMIYGACADITIDLNEKTYYIPAIIIDTKGHSAPTGIIQTGKSFTENYEETGIPGPIVEWYTGQFDEKGNNKAEGLDNFSRNGSIIIYREEILE